MTVHVYGCCKVDDMNLSNEDGLTVLHNGVCSGCLDVLEFLVHAGCDVNVADCDGWSFSLSFHYTINYHFITSFDENNAG